MNQLEYKTALGAASIDPWKTQFAFFWYNDEEIFSDTDQDLERKVEQLAASGVNHVITFSCTHFRWSFHDYWDLLNETLARVVRACHKHGVLVTEHHSSELSHCIGSDDDLAYLKNILRVRKSKVESWPKMIVSAKGDPMLIDDIKRSELIQIDGETGGFRPNVYHGYSMCFNNPHYRRAYFSYLESVYETGVDGIMTDDVQWLGGTPWHNGCACGHCRKRFAEKTGYELPAKGEAWARMIGDYQNPVFLAWLDFRMRSVEAFHQAVKAHYNSLNLCLLRPNYCSSVLNGNGSSYSLDTLPELDWVFQESCFSTIIRYSWPQWAVEQGHRYALGRVRSIPPMTMFYPDRPDTTMFCWSLAMSWGAKYLATDEGVIGNETEDRLRLFEEKHQRLLENPRKIANFAFYDSKRNRELYGRYEESSGPWTKAWFQACMFGNIACDFLLSSELERIGDYDVIALPDIAVLSDAEVRAFRDFATNGGTVIWGGDSGSIDQDGASRSREELASLLGVDEIPENPERDEVVIAKGRVVFLKNESDQVAQLTGINLMRFNADVKEQRVAHESLSAEHSQQFRKLAEFTESMIPGHSRLSVPNLPEGVLATVFAAHDESALVVHLVNTAGTLEVASREGVNHEDRIPFSAHADQLVAIELRLPRAWQSRELVGVFAYDPNQPDRQILIGNHEVERVVVKFDLSMLKEYALIELRLN